MQQQATARRVSADTRDLGDYIVHDLEHGYLHAVVTPDEARMVTRRLCGSCGPLGEIRSERDLDTVWLVLHVLTLRSSCETLGLTRSQFRALRYLQWRITQFERRDHKLDVRTRRRLARQLSSWLSDLPTNTRD